MYNFYTKFDYDLLKSKANLAKHGVSFEEARSLWAVEKACEIQASFVLEERWIRIGQIRGRCYSCIYTVRNGAVRIISCRRSRRKEEAKYREKTQEEN